MVGNRPPSHLASTPAYIMDSPPVWPIDVILQSFLDFSSPVHVDEREEVETERRSETTEQSTGEEEGVGVTLMVGRQVVVVQHADPAHAQQTHN